MKLEQSQQKVKGADDFKKTKMKVGDDAMLREMLSKKMYTDPVKAICQEVTSNARDAHREFGNPERPIEIKLPNDNDPTFHIRDFGVGIDPDRMETVFANYCVSTKRDSNKQTGGFGVGSKTPFAYADQFSIVAVTPDADGKMMKRIWYILRDDINLVSAVEAGPEDERGTTVIIPVDKSDRDRFERQIIGVCSWWSVRPNIIGSSMQWRDVTSADHSADDWYVLSNSAHNPTSNAMVLVDEIPYPVQPHTISESKNFSNKDRNRIQRILGNRNLALKVGVGELDLSFNREGLEYTTETINTLAAMALKVAGELESKIVNKINECKDIRSAFLMYYQSRDIVKNLHNSDYHFEPVWNGIELHKLSGGTSIPFTQVFKMERKYNGKYKMSNHGDSFVMSSYSVINSGGAKRSVVLWDEEGKKQPSRLRLETLMDSDSSIEEVWVVRSTIPEFNESDAVTEEAKEVIKAYKERTARQAAAMKKIGWNEYIVQGKTTDYERKKRVYAAGSGSARGMYRLLNDSRYHCAVSDMYETDNSVDETTGGVYVLSKNNKIGFDEDNINMTNKEFGEIRSCLYNMLSKINVDMTIHVISATQLSKLDSTWTPLADEIKDVVTQYVSSLSVSDRLKELGHFDEYKKVQTTNYRNMLNINNLSGMFNDLPKMIKNCDCLGFFEGYKEVPAMVDEINELCKEHERLTSLCNLDKVQDVRASVRRLSETHHNLLFLKDMIHNDETFGTGIIHDKVEELEKKISDMDNIFDDQYYYFNFQCGYYSRGDIGQKEFDYSMTVLNAAVEYLTEEK